MFHSITKTFKKGVLSKLLMGLLFATLIVAGFGMFNTGSVKVIAANITGCTVESDATILQALTNQNPSLGVSLLAGKKICKSGATPAATYSLCDSIDASNNGINCNALTYTGIDPNTQVVGNAVKAAAGPVATGIGAFFLGIVEMIVLFSVYVINWIGGAILWLVGIIFVNILVINPVSGTFVSVAEAPWKTLVSLGNLLTLSTFVFVGLGGYILNIKSLKTNIQTFLLNIAIFTLLMNFTLFGLSAAINVTQGLGDSMIAAYTGKSPSQDPFTGGQNDLISGVLLGLKNISIIRCGNDQLDGISETKCKSITSQRNGLGNEAIDTVGDFGNIGKAVSFGSVLEGKVDNTLLRATILEIVYFIVLVITILVIGKGVYMVLIRLVSLWFLLVVSPLALAAYFSPMQGIKKYAQDWAQKTWQLALFYPAVVLALILTGQVTFQFAKAINCQFAADKSKCTLSATPGAYLDSLQTYAAPASEGVAGIFKIVMGSILVGLFAAAVLMVVMLFIDKFIGPIAKAMAEQGGKLLTGARMLSMTGGAAIRTTGMVGDKLTRGFASRGFAALSERASRGQDKKLEKATRTIQAARDIINRPGASNTQKTNGKLALNKALKDQRDANLRIWGSEKIKKGITGNLADVVENSPDIMLATVGAPLVGGYLAYKNLETRAKAKGGVFGERGFGRSEAFMRSSGISDFLKQGGLYDIDADKKMQRFANQNKVGMQTKLEEDPNYSKNILNDSLEKVRASSLGYAEKVRNDVAEAKVNFYQKQFEVGGYTGKGFDGEMLKDLDRTLNQVAESGDRTLNRLAFTGRMAKLARSRYNNLSSEAQVKISKDFPVALPLDKMAQRFAELDIKEIAALDLANFGTLDIEGTPIRDQSIKSNPIIQANPNLLRERGYDKVFNKRGIDDAELIMERKGGFSRFKDLGADPKTSPVGIAYRAGVLAVTESGATEAQPDLIKNSLAPKIREIMEDDKISTDMKEANIEAASYLAYLDSFKKQTGIDLFAEQARLKSKEPGVGPKTPENIRAETQKLILDGEAEEVFVRQPGAESLLTTAIQNLNLASPDVQNSYAYKTATEAIANQNLSPEQRNDALKRIIGVAAIADLQGVPTNITNTSTAATKLIAGVDAGNMSSRSDTFAIKVIDNIKGTEGVDLNAAITTPAFKDAVGNREFVQKLVAKATGNAIGSEGILSPDRSEILEGIRPRRRAYYGAKLGEAITKYVETDHRDPDHRDPTYIKDVLKELSVERNLLSENNKLDGNTYFNEFMTKIDAKIDKNGKDFVASMQRRIDNNGNAQVEVEKVRSSLADSREKTFVGGFKALGSNESVITIDGLVKTPSSELVSDEVLKKEVPIINPNPPANPTS